jgi:LPS O-antigen subunit length determinant protein (WzzB/FepE family)
MTEYPTLNISSLFDILYRRRKLIAYTTIAAVVTGLLFYFIKPKKYEAELIFILKNPLYSDRNYLYNNETKFIDYFANDDDVDRLITMARSDSVQNKIINAFNLAEAYDYDSTSPRQVLKLRKFFNKNLNVYRTESKNVVLTYTDKDPDRAIKVASMCLDESERTLHSFYIGMRRSMYESIVGKIKEEDSTIHFLTDTLSKLRSRYGIYDIISPARYNIMLSAFKDNGKPDYAQGIEEIQNVESVKDELVADRAKHITLANQYTTGTSLTDMPFTYVVNRSRLPIKPKGMNLATILIACAFAGLFFSALYILALNFYKSISSRPHVSGDTK